jgi:hypothetical protein
MINSFESRSARVARRMAGSRKGEEIEVLLRRIQSAILLRRPRSAYTHKCDDLRCGAAIHRPGDPEPDGLEHAGARLRRVDGQLDRRLLMALPLELLRISRTRFSTRVSREDVLDAVDR